MMALVVTALVFTALASGLTATARAWQDGDAAAAAMQYSARAMGPVNRLLRNARYLGAVVPGTVAGQPASVVFWRADDFPADYSTNTTANPDGSIQFGEVSALVYDPVGKQIVLYQAVPYAAGTGSGVTAAPYAGLSASAFAALGGNPTCCMKLTDLTAANAAAQFQAVLAAAAANNGGVAAPVTLVRNVTVCQFAAVNSDPTSSTPTYATRPQLDYVVTITPPSPDGYTGGTSASAGNAIYGSAVLRGATTQPAW